MEGNSAIIGTFEGKCCDGTTFNNNEMMLPIELFKTLFESEEYKRALKNGHYIGFLGHPEDPGCQEFKDACIVMTECTIDDNGEVFGKFNLIDTPVGRVVKAFIDAGVKFGISIRGAGDVGSDGYVDPETFVFRGFDLVAFPAYDDCIPEFKQIAASEDLNKQVKYKKACAAIKKNLSSITSCTALEFIKTQFNPGTDEYATVESRIDELTAQEDDTDNILEAKLEGMTQLYLDAVEQIRELTNALIEANANCDKIEIRCSRKLASYNRIATAQLNKNEAKLRDTIVANKELRRKLSASKKEAVTAATELDEVKSELDRVKSTNLKYHKKIEANSETISQKDSAITSLQHRLDETVVSNQSLEKKASNLDEAVLDLENRVKAAEQRADEAKREIKASEQRAESAEQLVLAYQDAYANMYANALGVHLSGLSVTAATTVDELQQLISASTSSGSIPANPAILEDDDLFDDSEWPSDYDDDATDIVSM